MDPDLIAQTPAPHREDSKLLLIRRNPTTGMPKFEDLLFKDLPEITKAEKLNQSLWVRNRTKVFEARFYTKRPTGSLHEIVLVRELSDGKWQAIIRNVKRFEFPQTLHLVENSDISIICTEPGIIEFPKDGPTVFEICRRYGEMPLPPYIKNRSKERDHERYQSVWANQSKPQSVAAPTASLHFSEALCNDLIHGGVEFADIELDVGLGTFEPLRHSDIHLNELHKERFLVHQHTHSQLKTSLTNNRPLLCIGTTAMRCLESLGLGDMPYRGSEFFEDDIGNLKGETKIFIKPGTDIRYTSQLLTNFHLPESSLFVLVSTFAGSRTLAQEAYRHATAKKYRFFSYGDATLWL